LLVVLLSLAGWDWDRSAPGDSSRVAILSVAAHRLVAYCVALPGVPLTVAVCVSPFTHISAHFVTDAATSLAHPLHRRVQRASKRDGVRLAAPR